MMNQTYGQLVNGDRVVLQGYIFTVRNIRIIEEQRSFKWDGAGPGRGVVRFTGICEPGSQLEHTGYNGGTYGAYVHVPVSMAPTR